MLYIAILDPFWILTEKFRCKQNANNCQGSVIGLGLLLVEVSWGEITSCVVVAIYLRVEAYLLFLEPKEVSQCVVLRFLILFHSGRYFLTLLYYFIQAEITCGIRIEAFFWARLSVNNLAKILFVDVPGLIRWLDSWIFGVLLLLLDVEVHQVCQVHWIHYFHYIWLHNWIYFNLIGFIIAISWLIDISLIWAYNLIQSGV